MMKINSNSNIDGIYESAHIRKAPAETEKSSKLSPANRDRVEISRPGNANDELFAARSEVLKSVEKAADPSRLRRLQAYIENGTYHVDASKVANAILKRGS